MTRAPVRDFLVGCFLLLGIAAMAYLSMRIGGLGSGPPGGFKLFATFDETGGLKPRAPVEISGVKVGQVKAIALDKTYRAAGLHPYLAEFGNDAYRLFLQ